MDLQKVLGFPLDQVRIDPDGSSTPPEVSPLSPPTKPGRRGADARLLEATRIEGLEAPPPPPAAPAPALAPAAAVARAAAAVPVPVPAAVVPVPAQARPAAAPTHFTARLRRLVQGARDGVRPPRRWVLLALSSAVLGFGVTVLVALLVRGLRSGPVESAGAARSRAVGSAALAPGALPRAPVHEPCARQREPQLVTRGVSSSFAQEARALPGGVEVLLGLSLGGGTALGLELNATTLSASELMRDSSSRELLGVVPTPGSAPPGFVIDRASVGGFRDARTLPDRPGWALTRTNRALNLTERGTQHSLLLWPLTANEEVSRPKLERQDAAHLALVLRRGGRQGKLVIAWLDPELGEHTELRELPFTSGELGLPSLATQGSSAVVAAAARSAATAPWHVELASSEPKGRARRIDVRAVAADPEHDSFAPSITAVEGSRWFLQWTEGQQGLRRVRGLTLDAQFAALGEPIPLSPEAASAGGGSVLSVDDGLLSLFLIQRGTSYELWATTLSCR